MNKKPIQETLDWTVRRLKMGDGDYNMYVNVTKNNLYTFYGSYISDSNYKEYSDEIYCRLLPVINFENLSFYDNNEYYLLAYPLNEMSSKNGFTDEYEHQISFNVE